MLAETIIKNRINKLSQREPTHNHLEHVTITIRVRLFP